MVVSSLSSFRILNPRSDEGITSTAIAPQVLREALLPFLTQSNSTTGIWTDGHFDPQLLVRTALTHTGRTYLLQVLQQPTTCAKYGHCTQSHLPISSPLVLRLTVFDCKGAPIAM